MSIGDMRHRITFQKITTDDNENGFESETYEDIKTVWASVSNLSGREYFQAASIQQEKTVKFVIRAGVVIDEDMKILFQGKRYDINFIDNIKYKNKFIEIKASGVDEDGEN